MKKQYTISAAYQWSELNNKKNSELAIQLISEPLKKILEQGTWKLQYCLKTINGPSTKDNAQ